MPPSTPILLVLTQEAESKQPQCLKRYEQAYALRRQGYQIKDIAYHPRRNKRTVYAYLSPILSHETFLEWQPTIRRCGSGLDLCKGYFLEKLQQGYQQTKQLVTNIQRHFKWEYFYKG
ncbi:MAG: hypothetical protein AAF609_25575 [Cyanobacteria bacterium P01_C01_bin.120]